MIIRTAPGVNRDMQQADLTPAQRDQLCRLLFNNTDVANGRQVSVIMTDDRIEEIKLLLRWVGAVSGRPPDGVRDYEGTQFVVMEDVVYLNLDEEEREELAQALSAWEDFVAKPGKSVLLRGPEGVPSYGEHLCVLLGVVSALLDARWRLCPA
jgi:hypothetical protein